MKTRKYRKMKRTLETKQHRLECADRIRDVNWDLAQDCYERGDMDGYMQAYEAVAHWDQVSEDLHDSISRYQMKIMRANNVLEISDR